MASMDTNQGSRAEQAWKQLSAANRQRKKQVDRLLYNSVSGASRTRPAPEADPFSAAHTVGGKSQQASCQARPTGGPTGRPKPVPDAVTTPDQLSSGLAGLSLERSIQALQSPEAGVRRSALKQLKAAYVDSPTCSPAAAEEALSAGLGKALLRRFDDSSETCRDHAVAVLLQLLQQGEDMTLQLLPYAMPVLEERLQTLEGHQREPQEPSEEVRLQLLRLLHLLVRQAGEAVAAYASEAVAMLQVGLADGYYEVNLEACAAVQSITALLGMRLHQVSKQLVASLLPLTTHKRHRVRIAAMQALAPLVHQGAHEMILEMVAWRDPNVVPVAAFYGQDLKVNFCGKLAADPHVQVRLEFLRMIGNWMLTLPERQDHESRLLPYVLSGLTDDSPEVQAAALQLLQQLGAAYEKEHEQELQELLAYGGPGEAAGRVWRVAYGADSSSSSSAGGAGSSEGWAPSSSSTSCQVEEVEGADECPAGIAACGGAAGEAAGSWAAQALLGPKTAAAKAAAAAAEAAAAASDAETKAGPLCSEPGAAAVPPLASTTCLSAAAAAAAFPLPGPFSSRPGLGVRRLVQTNFARVAGALAAELASWQAEPRGRAAKLLLLNLVVLEEEVVPHLHLLLPALCRAMCDSEVSGDVAQAAAVIGCFSPFDQLLEVLLPRVQDASLGLAAQADALRVLAHAIRGAVWGGTLASHTTQLLDLLSSPPFSCSEDQGLNAACLLLLEQLSAGPGAAQLLLGSCQDSLTRLLRLLLGFSICPVPPAAAAAAAGAAGQQAAAGKVEQLLAGLAAGGGYSSVDQLLSCWADDVLDQVCPPGCLLSKCRRDAAACCRLLLPSWQALVLHSGDDSWQQQFTHGQEQQQQWESTSSMAPPPALGWQLQPRHMLLLLQQLSNSYSTSTSTSEGQRNGHTAISSNSSSNSAASVIEAGRTSGSGSAAAAGSNSTAYNSNASSSSSASSGGRGHVAVPAAHHHPQQQQELSAANRFLLRALGLCLQSWPAASLKGAVTEQLLGSTAPQLLGSSSGLAAMAGLRAWRLALARGLVGRQLLEEAWWGSCSAVAELLACQSLGHKLEAAQLLLEVAQLLPAGAFMQPCSGSNSTQQANSAGQPQQLLVQHLAAAADDASPQVRSRVAAILVLLLEKLGQQQQQEGGAACGGSGQAAGWQGQLAAALARAQLL